MNLKPCLRNRSPQYIWHLKVLFMETCMPLAYLDVRILLHSTLITFEINSQKQLTEGSNIIIYAHDIQGVNEFLERIREKGNRLKSLKMLHRYAHHKVKQI